MNIEQDKELVTSFITPTKDDKFTESKNENGDFKITFNDDKNFAIFSIKDGKNKAKLSNLKNWRQRQKEILKNFTERY